MKLTTEHKIRVGKNFVTLANYLRQLANYYEDKYDEQPILAKYCTITIEIKETENE